MQRISPLDFKHSGLSKKDWRTLSKLNSPSKIQNFLNTLKFNFEVRGETYRSVSEVLKAREAHCFEGALVAAAALWVHGERPLLLDLSTDPEDDDHVVVLFHREGKWGALSKTNHYVLRYRDPVYSNVRELVMSYFNEYFLEDGVKTLRSFSTKPLDLSRTKANWLSSSEQLFALVEELDSMPHTKILSPREAKALRPADKIERNALKLTEW